MASRYEPWIILVQGGESIYFATDTLTATAKKLSSCAAY